MRRLLRCSSLPALLLLAAPWSACAGPAAPATPAIPVEQPPDGRTTAATAAHLADRVVGAADLQAAVADGATSLTLQRVRFADARPFAGLRRRTTLRRVAFDATSVSRAALLDDVLALPNLEELDLGELPGLGRLGADAHADVESLTILRQLAESQPRSPRVRLRVRGRHDTPLEELLHLAARNVAAQDVAVGSLRGSAGLALDGPGAATPPRPVGSSFLPEQQQLAAAQQLHALAPALRARFELVP